MGAGPKDSIGRPPQGEGRYGTTFTRASIWFVLPRHTPPAAGGALYGRWEWVAHLSFCRCIIRWLIWYFIWILAISRIRFRGGREAGTRFTLTNTPPMETFGPVTLAQQVAELQQQNIPESARMEDAPGLAGPSLRINPRESTFVSSGDPTRICGFSS